MQASLSPPHDPFRSILKNIAPILIANIEIEITKSVITNIFIVIKITN